MNVKRRAVAISVLLAPLFAPAAAVAQIVNDPMRPPTAVYAAPGDKTAAAGPLLQSVMITPSERSAIIGGERVKLGGKYGEARVIKITESEVVLRSAGGIETLKMYPDIEMNPVKPAAPAPKKPARKRGRTRQ